MAVELATFEQIATILTQLGTNYSNLFTDYFNIFYSTEPMDVTLQYYDETGKLQTITIPNRAKDRTYILNGNGKPEGNVSGQAGALYQDLLNGNVYIKQVSASDVNGWQKIVTLSDLSGYISKGAGKPEGAILGEKGSLYIDINTSSLYVKDSASGNTGWILVSADTSVLAERDLSNITTDGESVIKNLANVAISDNETVASKEVLANKTQDIESNSTDEDKYPSVKATYDFVTGEINDLADKNFSNITNQAKSLFISSDKWSNGVLEATNPPIAAGNTITLNSGTKLLCANGATNTSVTTGSAYNVTALGPSKRSVAFFDNTLGALEIYEESKFLSQREEPTETAGVLWYNFETNEYRVYVGSEWIKRIGTVVAVASTDYNDIIEEFIPCITASVASTNDVRMVKSKTESSIGLLETEVSNISTYVNSILQGGSLALNGLYIITTTDSYGNWSREYYEDEEAATSNPKDVTKRVWLEQGGEIITSSDQEYSLYFTIPFSDDKYFIVKNFSSNSLSSVGMVYLGFYDKAATGAKTRSMGSGYAQVWYACGK